LIEANALTTTPDRHRVSCAVGHFISVIRLSHLSS